MALNFVPEDGTGLSTATSYTTVAFADAHFGDVDNTVWDGLSNDNKEDALNQAARYINRRFCSQFVGYKKRREQVLEWPRYDACTYDGWTIPGTEVPAEIQRAACEYALIYVTNGSLFPSSAGAADNASTGTPKTAETIKVGPITISEEFSDKGSSAGRATGTDVVSGALVPEYPTGDLYLQCLLRSIDTDIIRG